MITQALMEFYDEIVKLHEGGMSFNLTRWEGLYPV